MKRLFSCLLFVALILGGSNAFAQYLNWPEEDVFRTDEARYGHLAYFGFFGSAMGSWEFTQELAPFTNLTWIHVGWLPDDHTAAIAVLIERMNDARDAGVEAVLHIEPFLFTSDEGKLQPDDKIVDFLVELRAQIEFEDLLGTLAMIYPIDEPFRELIELRDPSFIKEHVTGEAYEDIHDDLVHLNELIRMAFPQTPIGVILSGHRLHHRFFSIPENYDWVGFDCYQELFRGCDDKSAVEHYAELLKHMQAQQRLIAVPETWALNENMGDPEWPDVLLSRLRQHYEIALYEPRFVAIIPFIWSFDSDEETPGLGLNRFDELFDDGVDNRGTAFVDQVIDIGLQVKIGLFESPNMAFDETENSAYRPVSRVRGEIMSVDHLGLISAWAINDALPHKNLRIQVMVRDSKGKLVHKSRAERTFIRDAGLADQLDVDSPMVGLHGYRYQLPSYVLERASRQNLEIELLVYADGFLWEIGSMDTLVLKARLKPFPLTRNQTGQSIPSYAKNRSPGSSFQGWSVKSKE